MEHVFQRYGRGIFGIDRLTSRESKLQFLQMDEIEAFVPYFLV